jgi:hypothetical protein
LSALSDCCRFDTFLKKSTNDCPPSQKSKSTTELSNFHCPLFAVKKWTVSRGLYKFVGLHVVQHCLQRDGGLAQRRHLRTTFQIRNSRRRCAKPLVVRSVFFESVARFTTLSVCTSLSVRYSIPLHCRLALHCRPSTQFHYFFGCTSLSVWYSIPLLCRLSVHCRDEILFRQCFRC